MSLIDLYRKKKYYKIKTFTNKKSSLTAYIRDLNNQKIAGFGFLDLEKDYGSFQKLIDDTESWLRENKIKKHFAPMNFNSWYEYRIASGYLKNPPFALEKIYPNYYLDFIKRSGFAPSINYFSYIITKPVPLMTHLKPLVKKINKLGFRLREISAEERETVLESIYDISVESFKDAPFFEEISYKEFYLLYEPLISKIQERYIIIAEKEDVIEGFIFSLPSQDQLIIKTVGVKPSLQGKYIAPVLIYETYKRGCEDNFSKFIHAYMREGISTHHFSERHGHIYRKYTLYEKAL
jgi:hypothetical protein